MAKKLTFVTEAQIGQFVERNIVLIQNLVLLIVSLDLLTDQLLFDDRWVANISKSEFFAHFYVNFFWAFASFILSF